MRCYLRRDDRWVWCGKWSKTIFWCLKFLTFVMSWEEKEVKRRSGWGGGRYRRSLRKWKWGWKVMSCGLERGGATRLGLEVTGCSRDNAKLLSLIWNWCWWFDGRENLPLVPTREDRTWNVGSCHFYRYGDHIDLCLAIGVTPFAMLVVFVQLFLCTLTYIIILIIMGPAVETVASDLLTRE